jgi:predicted secreted protein
MTDRHELEHEHALKHLRLMFSDQHLREPLIEQLADARSHRVVFVSHCLLNENTRYLGGACVPGCLPEVVEQCIEQRLGIVHMPCPEQQGWGGVLKPMLLRAYGLKRRSPVMFAMRRPLLAVFRWHTRRLYRKLARQVASEIADYLSSGIEVHAIVGVDGSPSCGVSATMDLRSALERVTRLAPSSLTPAILNRELRACVVTGRGVFIDELRRELTRRRIEVPFAAHDLYGELGARGLQAAGRST